ncbi:hypothetical protein P8452_76456 [Trifolium repens]|nr:hypothetical protein P8452_76456 [Trifolium repens]
MEDNDNTKGGGRGTGRGINRGRKDKGATTLSQSNIGKPINPSKAHIATNTQLHPTHLSSKRDKVSGSASDIPLFLCSNSFWICFTDTCGYDMKKSLEKLLDQAFDKSPADVHDSSEKFADMKTKSEAPASEKRSQDLNCNRGLKFPLLCTPHICPTPSPSHVPLDAALGDDPPPQIGSKDPSDGRIWICPGPTKTFNPCIKPRREITKIIKRKFEGSWTTYGEIKGKKDKGKNEEEYNNNKKNDKDVAELWFGEFKRKFKWLPEHDEDIKKAFDHKASSSYSNAMYRVRKGIDQGDWIPNKMRAILDDKWKEDNWKRKAELNKVNRISYDCPLHIGGSIPTTEHYKRLKKSSDTSPTCWQLFQTTHKIKGDPNKWVSKKSEGIANKYEEKIVERDSQEPLGDDASIHQADDIIFLDVVGGVDKKGPIYGLGPEAEKYKPSRSSTYHVNAIALFIYQK